MRRPDRARRLAALTVLLVAPALAWAGCGGKAIIDDPLGAGGAGSNTAGPSTSGPSPLCQTTTPVGMLSDCGGTAAVTTGGGLSCTTSLCDSADNEWTSECDSTGCVCRFNGNVACTCVVNGGDPCSNLVGSCCPSPFPS